MYDVIVVGARVAGSATALLLARRGLKVLVLDQATFPSDTLSTHQVQMSGVARLARWGVLDRVMSSNVPPTRHVKFDQGFVVLEGDWPRLGDLDFMCSPRRTILDAILVDEARRAGAEVREAVVAEDLLQEDGRVAGVRGREKHGSSFTERARLVVGADGKHSMVASAVAAAAYNQEPPLTLAFYTYWEGFELEGGEMYARGRRAVGAWPTNDGLAMTYVSWPVAEFESFRADVERGFMATLDAAGDLGQRVRAGRRVERIRGTVDLPNRFRQAHGLGWALVGDAGLVMDPITGAGISDALRDAELLSGAVADGLGGRRPLDQALAGYQRERDRQAMPMYMLTTDIASFRPPDTAQKVLFEALARNQAEAVRFLGLLTGAVPLAGYFSPANLLRVVGLRGFARMMRAGIGGRSGRAAVAEAAAGGHDDDQRQHAEGDHRADLVGAGGGEEIARQAL